MKTRTPLEFYGNMGKNIRNARTMAGMSQQNIGDALGITFQQQQKYEKGVNRCPIHHLVTISQITSVPMMDIIGLRDVKDASKRRELTLMRKLLDMPDDYLMLVEKMVTELGKMGA
jgi:transcriptional regulator with XRE-family HTH domain